MEKKITPGDEPAFASVAYGQLDQGYCQTGLTKREYFAAMAMQGLLANNITGGTAEEIASRSIQSADALIKSLNT